LCFLPSRHAGGFTLIEVMVAVFVLAIGIVGATATQLTALRTREGTAHLSRGVQLATTLAERMRANAQQMQLADARNPYLQMHYDAASDGAPAGARPCHRGASCSSADLAAFDLHEIKQGLRAGFPGGRATVCRDAAVWDASRAALSWRCSGGPFDPIVIKLGWRGREAADAPRLAIIVAGGYS
jgi:type IV pilus assembly protein PilV